MTETITLGGRRFELRPLKLGQLRHLLDALDAMAGTSGGALIEAAVKVVAAGLAPTHPEATAEMLLDLEATVDELNAAVAAILGLAGLRRTGLRHTGEAPPVASLATTSLGNSAPSTAPSPPAANILIEPSTV
jgi:hypothetical protein